ncbi:uncharacterized protein LOC127255593 [Andrographis paniculata]|uniref:uncharacterized protein LOC127255593 n=1 Tax=Andrographis paniculata TaxID=175694 RepID=UPI0021E729C6|nr:uncharacterized protein LOC127255593 [Andrographis paniculata]
METFASFLCRSASPPTPPLPSVGSLSSRRFWPSVSRAVAVRRSDCGKSRCFSARIFACSSSSVSVWEFRDGDENSRSKRSALFNLIRDIEPLDVSLIQKDVPVTTIDAMKRTISGMLGLLPSDHFQVMIEALWESLSKLLISSMMTGYTLRNAEYRLSLEKNLEMNEGDDCMLNIEDSKLEAEEADLKNKGTSKNDKQEQEPASDRTGETAFDIPDFGELPPEARQYILKLHSRLSSVKKELHEITKKSAALQMQQQFVGEEKNDLLDYLRSLKPEKVVELSEPTSPELKNTIHSVVHGLLATLSPKMHSKGWDLGENGTIGTINTGTEGDCIDLVENTSLQFQPLISLPRDYLARLLFWCMLLGHYLRGLEYRLELTKLMTIPENDGEQPHPAC